MQFYFVVLFVHISSALALFMGMAIGWVGINRLQHADSKNQIVEWVKILLSLKYIFMIAGILLLITGGYMASDKWGWTPWIFVSILLWLYIALHGSLVLGKKFDKLNKSIISESQKTIDELHVDIVHLKLLNNLQSELAVALGTVFIMTVKPDLVGSICVVLVAIILAIVPLLSKRNTAESK